VAKRAYCICELFGREFAVEVPVEIGEHLAILNNKRLCPLS
jgi:hypothetical protein